MWSFRTQPVERTWSEPPAPAKVARMDAPVATSRPLKAWITTEAVAALLDAYRRATAAEPCGVLVGRVTGDAVRIDEVIEVRNAHARPLEAFLIAEDDLLAVSKTVATAGKAIVGFWHGHAKGGAFPGFSDGAEFLDFAAGPNGAWARVLLVIGRGAGDHPVLRTYVASRDGLREVPLGT